MPTFDQGTYQYLLSGSNSVQGRGLLKRTGDAIQSASIQYLFIFHSAHQSQEEIWIIVNSFHCFPEEPIIYLLTYLCYFLDFQMWYIGVYSTFLKVLHLPVIRKQSRYSFSLLLPGYLYVPILSILHLGSSPVFHRTTFGTLSSKQCL